MSSATLPRDNSTCGVNDGSFNEVVDQVQSTMNEASARQDVPFEQIVLSYRRAVDVVEEEGRDECRDEGVSSTKYIKYVT